MIEASRLSKLYTRGVYALQDLSLTVEDGEFLTLRRISLLLSRSLQFVTILLVVEFQLGHLLLRDAGTATGPTSTLLTLHHQMLFRPQL